MSTLKTMSVTLITLLTISGAATAAGMGNTPCTAHPRTAYNGLVPIEYPRSTTASVTRICGGRAWDIEDDLKQQAKRLNVNIQWVEVYRVSRWTSVFHDLIYKSRAYGFQQTDYRRYSVVNYKDSSTLVYANSAGRYLGMIVQEIPAATRGTEGLFILYGN